MSVCVLLVEDLVPFRAHPVYENVHVYIHIVRKCVLLCVCEYCSGVCMSEYVRITCGRFCSISVTSCV